MKMNKKIILMFGISIFLVGTIFAVSLTNTQKGEKALTLLGVDTNKLQSVELIDLDTKIKDKKLNISEGNQLKLKIYEIDYTGQDKPIYMISNE